MFYSQTFLARKGPLGTVWCAAHLQHRLKKSHYAATDIPSTVDRIMFPEVPIALRMSGHLLLGVVRIYSKKVEYLFHDCNVVLTGLRKAFASIEVNLPEDARQAPIHAITLPETFDLDALNLDDDIYNEGVPDNHLRSQEDITLTVQIPIERDPYIAISFDEDILMDSSHQEEIPYLGVRTMEYILPPAVETDVGFQEPGPNNQAEVNETGGFPDIGPSNQTEALDEMVNFPDPGPTNGAEIFNMGLSGGNSPQNLPEIEVMRDAVHDFISENLPPVLPTSGNDVADLNSSAGKDLNDKETCTPNVEDILTFAAQDQSPMQQHSVPPPSSASQGAPEIFDTHVSFGHISPELAIRSSPPVQLLRPRQRKRKYFFDKSTVLTNKFMKGSLEDPSDILRKRRKLPSTSLGTWKWDNNLRKERSFHEPLMAGLCADICNIFNKDCISVRPHLVAVPEVVPEPNIAATPAPTTEDIPEPSNANSAAFANDAIPEALVAQSPATVFETDMEIEHLRHGGHIDDSILPEFMPSPSRRDESTHVSEKGFGLPTPDFAASTGTYGSELETPVTFIEDQQGVEGTGLSDIPELINSAEAEALSFLEADNNTSACSQGTQGIESLSVRTRAVAQFLRSHSPITPMSEDSHGDLSLSKILQGKTRRLCARMFFETLVLKSYELVDVLQEQPYGDITLKLTPQLSKAQL